MARCAYCGTIVLFGGVKDESGARYCKQECADGGALVELSDQIPEDLVRETVRETFQGPCPICEGEGPVDVAHAYKVWSAVFMTSWSTDVHVCCRSCARKRQAWRLVTCLVVGWWGIPWGLIMTPVQMGRNVTAMARPYPTEPSADLERIVRVALANQMVEQHYAEQAEQHPGAELPAPDASLAPEIRDLPPERFDPGAIDPGSFSRGGSIEPR